MTTSRSAQSQDVFSRTFGALKQPHFRNLWIGTLLHMGAMQMQHLARGYFAYELTNSATLFGLITGAAALTGITVGLFSGVIADRLDKKWLIQVGQSLSLPLALFIAISITTDTITWQHLMAASLVQGLVMPLTMPSRQAIVPQLVEKDRLMNAVALTAMAMSFMTLVGPAVAGALIAIIGVDGVYYFAAAMYASAILFTAFLPSSVSDEPSRADKTPVLEGVKQGIQYVRQNPLIFHLLLLACSMMALAIPVQMVLPIFAKDVFSTGSGGLGIMMSVVGVGALGGALLIASLRQVSRRGPKLMASGVATGAVLLAFGMISEVSPVFWIALSILFLMGLLQSARMTLINGLIIEYTNEQYRGRVMSLFTLNFSFVPLMVLMLGGLIEITSPPIAAGVMGIALVLATAIAVLVSPQLRQLE